MKQILFIIILIYFNQNYAMDHTSSSSKKINYIYLDEAMLKLDRCEIWMWYANGKFRIFDLSEANDNLIPLKKNTISIAVMFGIQSNASIYKVTTIPIKGNKHSYILKKSDILESGFKFTCDRRFIYKKIV